MTTGQWKNIKVQLQKVETNEDLAKIIISGAVDNLPQLIETMGTFVDNGSTFGVSVFQSKTLLREDYIFQLDVATPAVSTKAMSISRGAMARYTSPTSAVSPFLNDRDISEISRLLQFGTLNIPDFLSEFHENPKFSDTNVAQKIQTRCSDKDVLSLVDEVITYRLSRQDCGEFAMRHQSMHSVANSALQSLHEKDDSFLTEDE
ncbi:hypothetical protein BGZ49_009883 [Haplosporangium sp. Z 27]|nr:hypothetical protein BGZ49_009883 [Haplosporangium sp. Z 27]